MTIVYDAGVLVAAERNERQVWLEHRIWLELGVVPTTTAPVVAQASRSPQQVQLRRFLRGCYVESFAPEQTHVVGALLAKAASNDVVDAHLVVTAVAHSSIIWTSDVRDLRRLSEELAVPLEIRRI